MNRNILIGAVLFSLFSIGLALPQTLFADELADVSTSGATSAWEDDGQGTITVTVWAWSKQKYFFEDPDSDSEFQGDIETTLVGLTIKDHLDSIGEQGHVDGRDVNLFLEHLFPPPGEGGQFEHLGLVKYVSYRTIEFTITYGPGGNNNNNQGGGNPEGN